MERADHVGQRRVYDVQEEIEKLLPDESQLLVFLTKLRSKVTDDPKFFWHEKTLSPRWSKINCAAGYTSADTDIVVANITYFRAGDIVKVPRTKETMRVTLVTAATSTLTVTRSIGATYAATALIHNDDLLIIGNSNQEGAGTRSIKLPKPTEKYNYTQIIRTPFGLTETEKHCKNKGEKTLPEMKKEELLTHRIDIERTLIFSERSEETSGEHAERTTGGVLEWLETCPNYKDFGDWPTQAEFNKWLEKVMRFGKKTKAFVCSRAWATVFDTWATDKVMISQSETTLGMVIKKYKTVHGELVLIVTDIFEGPIFGYMGIVMDMSKLMIRFIEGRKHILREDIQDNDADEEMGEYLSELGLQLANVETFGVAIYAQS
jgi:hypothetical protein